MSKSTGTTDHYFRARVGIAYYHPPEEQREGSRDGFRIPMMTTEIEYYVSTVGQLVDLLTDVLTRQYMWWPIGITITPDHMCQVPPDWPAYMSTEYCEGCKRIDRSLP